MRIPWSADVVGWLRLTVLVLSGGPAPRALAGTLSGLSNTKVKRWMDNLKFFKTLCLFTKASYINQFPWIFQPRETYVPGGCGGGPLFAADGKWDVVAVGRSVLVGRGWSLDAEVCWVSGPDVATTAILFHFIYQISLICLGENQWPLSVCVLYCLVSSFKYYLPAQSFLIFPTGRARIYSKYHSMNRKEKPRAVLLKCLVSSTFQKLV